MLSYTKLGSESYRPDCEGEECWQIYATRCGN